jgi:2-polyprenyl-3-methyl-5-hydroxy-6-metoxy-1,4-benzoquinol methylase
MQDDSEHLIRGCYYCISYQEIIEDYPINEIYIDSLNVSKETPRCFLHFQFQCDSCKKNIHFNGICWCFKCKKFTCIHCGNVKVNKKKFFIYEDYYEITCNWCNNSNPALDAAEYLLNHPYQIGDIRPSYPINLWIPMTEVVKNDSSYSYNRFSNNFIIEVKKVDNSTDEVDIWNNLSKQWATKILEDKNHIYNLHPAIVEQLGDISSLKILDFGCGSGGLARKLTEAAEIVGLDPSNMIDFAIKEEKEHTLGIKYIKQKLEVVSEKYQNYFDLVVANTVLIDLPNLDLAYEQIYSVLKLGGRFIFTITHPAFTSPVSNTIRIPADSNRNEDRMKINGDYFDESVYSIKERNSDNQPLIHHHRTISTYINKLIQNGFTLKEIKETKPTKEAIQRFPLSYYKKSEKIPMFMLIIAEKY